MDVTVKLFTFLSKYLPPHATEHQVSMKLDEGTSVAAVIQQLKVPPEECHLVLVNGAYVPEDQRASRPLSSGDVLAIWPKVAGG